VLKTGQARDGSPEAESNEGMLLEFHNVTVTDPFPDRPANYGEIVIDDGSGGYRVGDDFSIAYRGNLDSTFALGDKIEKIIGIGNFSFYHYKLDPRNESDIIGHTTGIKQKRVSHELIYDLSQNYPNPFNPTTTIAYRIGKKGAVELSIYNVLGQKIKTLVDEVKPAGNYQVSWDGTNQLGQLVSSGIYFYSLKSGEFIKTNKMVLLR
ncbi:MAG: T9SS type A sorting domain-containing protein, partial [candidate division KSB1 bacterium]|nr:T9SS type A sorting domain-containing protein [candidate division KSB1 bacterium]